MRRRQFCRVFGCTMAWSMLPGSITTEAADSIEDIGYWRRFSQELTPAHDPRAAKGPRRLRRLTCRRNRDSQRVSCYPHGQTVGRRDRPRIGAVCPLVRLVSGGGDHIIGDRPRPDPVWETARLSVTPAPTAVLGAVPCFRRPL